ncbi:MAG: M23 family metallopeptidase [Patescibacteria group bacterium]
MMLQPMKKNIARIATVLGLMTILLTQFASPLYAADDLSNLDGQAISQGIRKADQNDAEISGFKLSTFYQFPVASKSFKGLSQKFTRFHPGYDIRATFGSEIYPVRSGTVVNVEFEKGGYGRYVLIEHENGIQTLYAHMSKTTMKVGDKVDTSDVIGYVGLTGHSTGPHVHFEVRVTGGKRVNPGFILPEIAVGVGSVIASAK